MLKRRETWPLNYSPVRAKFMAKPIRLGLFDLKRDLHVDAIGVDDAILDGHGEVVDAGRAHMLDRSGKAANALGNGLFEGFGGIRQDLRGFQYRHGLCSPLLPPRPVPGAVLVNAISTW